MGFKSLVSSTDSEVLQALGARLRSLRNRQDLSLVDAAAQSGLSRRTIYRAENGDNPTLLTLVRLLRLYRSLDGLEAFLPESEISPMSVLASSTQRAKKGPRGDR